MSVGVWAVLGLFCAAKRTIGCCGWFRCGEVGVWELFCAAKLTRRHYGWLRCVGVGVLKSTFLFRGEDLAGISSAKSTNLSLYEDLTA